jgi:hypothetical protein
MVYRDKVLQSLGSTSLVYYSTYDHFVFIYGIMLALIKIEQFIFR